MLYLRLTCSKTRARGGGGGLISDNRLSAARSGPLVLNLRGWLLPRYVSTFLKMQFCTNRVAVVPATAIVDDQELFVSNGARANIMD